MAWIIKVECDRGEEEFGVVVHSKGWHEGSEGGEHSISRQLGNPARFETKAEANEVKRRFDRNMMCDHFSFNVVEVN